MKIPKTNIEVSNFSHIVFLGKAHYVKDYPIWIKDGGVDYIPHDQMVKRLKHIMSSDKFKVWLSGDYINIALAKGA
jgi:hypothetical protein